SINFSRKLNTHYQDKAYIDISNDNGLTWQNIYTNFNYEQDKDWKVFSYNVSEYFNKKQQTKIRFALGPIYSGKNYSGWNIDEFSVTGDSIINDVGVVKWVSPLSGCGHTSHDTVKIWVKNFTTITSPSIIPVAYTFDNGATLIKDTIKQSIPAGDSILFTFKTTVNLTNADLYNNVYATTLLANEDYIDNDKLTYSIAALPTYTIPVNEDFEGLKNFWSAGGTNSSWLLGEPYTDSIQWAPSGYKIWKTSLYMYHNNNENSYVQSPCFNIEDTSKVIVEFKYYSLQHQGTSGCALQYSIDNGTSWNVVPKHSYPWKWNWYNSNNVAVLGTAGWDSITPGWVTAKQVLPNTLLNKGQLKFRFVFKSNDNAPWEGFAFDDFKVYKAPINIKLDSITSHKNNCQKVNPKKVSVHVTNNGIRSIIANKDTAILALKLNGGSEIADTLVFTSNVPIGSSTTLTFNKEINAEAAGNYQLVVYHKDPYKGFYPKTDNDTVTKNFTILQNPVSGLAAQYSTARLDTYKIQANINAQYTYKWQNATNSNLSSTSSLTKPPVGKCWLKLTYNATTCSITDTFKVVKLIPDVGVSEIYDPVNACEFKTPVKMSVAIKNLGTDTLKKNDTIYLAYLDHAKTLSKDTIKLKATFKPGDTIHYSTKKNPMNMTAFQAYNLKAYTIYKYDSVPANDTTKLTIQAWGYPTVYIGPDKTVSKYDTIKLNNTFKTYLWSDNTTDTFYVARYIGKHWVRVTDYHDCPASDTANLTIVAFDISANKIVSPVSACKLSSTQKFTFRYKNVGTDTIPINTILDIKYRINGNAWRTASIPLPDTLFAGDYYDYQFNQNENLSAIGQYKCEAVVKISGDIDATNDTIKETINVYGYPNVNIGPDAEVEALSYTLDAGSAPNQTYLWSNGATTSNITVYSSNQYSVMVTNTNTGCISRDTAIITLKIKDIQPSATDLVSIACEKAVNTATVEIINNGNNPLPINTKFYVSYKLNSLAEVKDSVILTSAMPVGGKIYHTFSNLRNKFSVGANKIKIYTKMTGDLQAANDTLVHNITINAVPWVDFGGTNDTILTTPPYLLIAPAGVNLQYTWQDPTFFGSTYTVNNSGLYHVNVNNTVTGCSDRDTVYVKIFIPDGSITNVISPSEICLGTTDTMRVEFTNVGNTIMAKGENILFTYKIGTSTPVSELYVLNSNLNPGDKLYYTFSGLKNKINTAKNYSFTFYAILENDINSTNDKAYFTLKVNALPNVSLAAGQDTLQDYAGTQIFSGLGSGYSYLWNTGLTNDYLTVTEPGTYTETVTNLTTGCKNKDSVYVYILKPDNAITSTDLPGQTCISSTLSMNVTYSNLGNMNDFEYDPLNIHVRNMTNNKIINIYRNLVADLKPGHSLNIFIDRIDTILNLGANKLKIYTDSYLPDVNLNNDTLLKNIFVYPQKVFSSANILSCDQANYTLPSGRVVNTSGVYLDTIASVGGCDSIMTINLKMGNSKTQTLYTTLCQGNTYTSPKGKIYSETGIYRDTLVAASGCDSIIISNITVNPIKISNISKTICKGDTYNGHSQSGTYTDHYLTYLGCDSTVNLTLSVKDVFADTVDVYICRGQTYKGHNTSGFYPESFVSVSGCDSIVTTNLIVSDSVVVNITKEICAGQSYNGHTTAGTFRNVFASSAGCDSIVYTKLVILPAPTVNLAGGADTASVQMPYFLIAGSSDSYKYLWSDNSTDKMLIVNKGGLYKVKVTDPTNNCSTTDSVFLKNKANVIFIEVTKISGLVDTCYGVTNTLSAEVKNVSGSSMTSGSKIKLNLLVDNILKKEGTITLTSNLANNGTVSYNFGDISSKLHVGKNVIKVRTNIDGYEDDENSYKTQTIQILSSAKPILAGGLNKVDFIGTYTLDAGTGFTSYLWSNNSTNQTLTVSSSGTYWVHVTNPNGCINGDTVVMNNKVGIENGTMDRLLVYPNPVKTILKMKVPQCTENSFNLEIYSSDMRQVVTMKKMANNGFMEIDVANLKNGVYYIRIKSVECTYTEKFIKE
ncbi:MAG TPA: T9SS type A sorting domain-containing protein, partial [Bacteroidales bacterium]|nr:T9SS type A sorting domain-containing protein [Bacteroidales bacterium]